MESVREAQKKDQLKRTLIFYIALFVGFALVGILVPDNPDEFGILTCIPAAFMIFFIFKTKRIIEGLTLAVLLCCIMVHKQNFIIEFANIAQTTMMDEDIAFLIIVCGLMGSLVAVIEKNGGGLAFGKFVASKAKSEKTALFGTMLCSALFSMDDYLSSLTSGIAMTPVTDRYRVPREMTSYVIDTTAAPVTVLNPISTWAVFIGGLMVANGLAEEGQQLTTYMKTVPFNFYAISTLVVLVLVILGVIPKFGPMKKAYERVAAGGPLAPPGSEKIDIRAGKEMVEFEDDVEDEMKSCKKPKLRNFFVPIFILIGAICMFDFNMQIGIIIAILLGFVFFVFQGMDPEEYADAVVEGLKNMVMPILLMILAFCFANASQQVGFIDYVIDVAVRNIALPLLPITVFLVFACTEFIMGINWGMYIIALPIVAPITIALGGDIGVTVGAVAAAGVWGSHCCFYSDATILTSASTGCDNFKHATSQIPFGLIAGIFSAIAYLILGFVLYA